MRHNMKNFIYIPAARAVVRECVRDTLEKQVALIPEPEAKQVTRIIKALGRQISKDIGTLHDDQLVGTLSPR